MKQPRRRITRREFVGGALAAAGSWPAAPAILRGQNPNNKLNLAMIGVGGRVARTSKASRRKTSWRSSMSTVWLSMPAAQQYPQARKFSYLRKVSTTRAIRRGGREHVRAHARVFHDARPRRGQARVLREADSLTTSGRRAAPRKAANEKVATQWGSRSMPVTTTAASSSSCRADRSAPSASARPGRVRGGFDQGSSGPQQGRRVRPERPAAEPVPDGLDWDLCSARRLRGRSTPSTFLARSCTAGGTFGSGTMSDLGSHWNACRSGRSSSKHADDRGHGWTRAPGDSASRR